VQGCKRLEWEFWRDGSVRAEEGRESIIVSLAIIHASADSYSCYFVIGSCHAMTCRA